MLGHVRAGCWPRPAPTPLAFEDGVLAVGEGQLEDILMRD